MGYEDSKILEQGPSADDSLEEITPQNLSMAQNFPENNPYNDDKSQKTRFAYQLSNYQQKQTNDLSQISNNLFPLGTKGYDPSFHDKCKRNITNSRLHRRLVEDKEIQNRNG